MNNKSTLSIRYEDKEDNDDNVVLYSDKIWGYDNREGNVSILIAMFPLAYHFECADPSCLTCTYIRLQKLVLRKWLSFQGTYISQVTFITVISLSLERYFLWRFWGRFENDNALRIFLPERSSGRRRRVRTKIGLFVLLGTILSNVQSFEMWLDYFYVVFLGKEAEHGANFVQLSQWLWPLSASSS